MVGVIHTQALALEQPTPTHNMQTETIRIVGDAGYKPAPKRRAGAHMSELYLPKSPDELSARLKVLHAGRKKLPRTGRRLSLTVQQRGIVLGKTAGRCHLCGGEIDETRFAADHVLAHAAGGAHALDNYLAAHGICNGCRWFYSPEEFQWILRMGIWARKQMEDRTPIGTTMLSSFLKHE